MPATPNLSLPYPVQSDTADVPRDIQALASRLDIVAGGPLVTSLPGSPVDGQEAYYLADAANGIVWHLRYRAASGSAYKWEFLGGASLYAERMIEDTIAVAAGSWSGAPNDPIITVPLGGDYRVELWAYTYIDQGPCNMLMGVRVGAIDPTVGAGATQALAGSVNQPVSLAYSRLFAGNAAATQVRHRFWYQKAGTMVRGGAAITATPVRVG